MTTRFRKLASTALGVIIVALAASTVSHAALPMSLTTRAVYNQWGFFVGYRQDIGPANSNPLKDILNIQAFRLSGEWEPKTPIIWHFTFIPPFSGTGIPAEMGPGFFTGLEAVATPEIGGHVDTYMMEAPFDPGTHGPAMRFFAGPGDYVLARNTQTGEVITYGPNDIEEVTVVPEPGSILGLAAMLPMALLLRRRS